MNPVTWLRVVALALVTCLPALAGAQETTESARQRLLMDYGWTSTVGDPDGAERPDFDDSGWRTLDLPHDWSIEGAFREDAPTTGRGGYLPAGVGWYRRTFTVPGGVAGRHVWVQFDGIHQLSDVWLNGEHLGHRPYGYVSFMYDLTPHLVDGENVLAVRVDNSNQPNSRWYTGSGIYRHVWLTVTDPLHIGHWGTFVTTPVVDSAAATVAVETRLENAGAGPREGTLRLEVLDPEDRVVANGEAPFRLEAGRADTTVSELRVAAPALWDIEAPNLYSLRSVVVDGSGEAVDTAETPFGIRHIAYDPDRGFLLNGRQVKHRGVNLHHGGGPVGAAVPEAVWERRFRLLKAMGVNAIRTAHNPMAPEFYDLCDRMGFLVMDEAFDEWTHGKVEYGYHRYFAEWGERDLAEFMRRDRNHPSVVLWSLGNEIGEQHAEDGDTILAMLRAVAKREDTTRPITTGNDHIYADDGATTDTFMALLDVVGYNYVDRWHERREIYNEQDRHAHPDWKWIGTESAAVWASRGEYSLGSDPDHPIASYTNGMIRAEQLWKWITTHDHYAGDYMWTGIDYHGESRWPRKNSTSGQLDLVGFPDDGYYFYRSLWTDEPMLHLFPHWNWEGREGQVIPVLAYSNLDVVELYLNGRFIGQKRIQFPRPGNSGSWFEYDERPIRPTTADLHVSWDVPYEPGVLRAVGLREGEVVVETEVRTAGEPARLRVSADRDTIRAGERDVAHVAVEVVDGAGTVVPDADPMIRVSVDGPARLLAVGNGDPADHTPYGIPRRRAFHGLALALIQSTDEAGRVRITVAVEGLEPVELEITVEPGDPVPRLP